MKFEENSEAEITLHESLERSENLEDFENISAKFSCLVITIKSLHKKRCSLILICEIIADLKQEFEEDVEIPVAIRDIVIKVFKDNGGFTQMININNCIITGVKQNLSNNWDINDAL